VLYPFNTTIFCLNTFIYSLYFHESLSKLMMQLRYFLFIPLLIIGCSNAKVVSIPSTDSPPEVDGFIGNWNIAESELESTDLFRYLATYDDEHLYLFIEFRSLFYHEAAKRSGFIVYLSNDQKNRRARGVAFPSGSFNLLRENPGMYDTFISDPEWIQKPDSQRMLENMELDNYHRLMIIDKRTRKSNPSYGFANIEQVEAEGTLLRVNPDSRLTTLELKIPLDGSAPFQINKGNLWIGFAIEPPEFRLGNTDIAAAPTEMDRYYRQQYGQNVRTANITQRHNLQRRMGQFDSWFRVKIE